jgi:hypothetical protein
MSAFNYIPNRAESFGNCFFFLLKWKVVEASKLLDPLYEVNFSLLQLLERGIYIGSIPVVEVISK